MLLVVDCFCALPSSDQHRLPSAASMSCRRNILIVAYPGHGSLNPSLRFAKRLLHMGVDVTYSTSLSAIRRIDKKTTPHGLTLSAFSDGHDAGHQPNTTLQQFISDFATNGAVSVAEIITSAAAAGHPFDHLIYTTAAPWAARVADAHSLKSTVLWCQSATAMDVYYYHFNGYQDLISNNNNNPTFPINFPGLPPLTIADLPSFFLPSNENENQFVVYTEQLGLLSAILIERRNGNTTPLAFERPGLSQSIRSCNKLLKTECPLLP